MRPLATSVSSEISPYALRPLADGEGAARAVVIEGGDDYPAGCTFRGPAKAGDRIRTGDVQLGKLTFYH